MRRIFEPGSWATWTEMIGTEVIPDQRPVAAGFPGLGLLKVTETGGAYPAFRVPLRALAPME
jgi:hypothetical protein